VLKDRLKEARQLRGLTQIELADRMGVVGSTISGYEIGRSEPDIAQLSQLMQILGVDANYLLQDEMAAYTSVSSSVLSIDEAELIQLYRAMNPAGQSAVMSTVRIMSGNPDMQKNTSAKMA